MSRYRRHENPSYVPQSHQTRRFCRLVEEGGDWDRRNRLKVYEGLHLLSTRQFKQGGELFLDALSTFTATELLSYKDFVTLTVIANVLTLGRRDIKKKIIDSPEVLQVIDEIDHLRAFSSSLYNCDYAAFFKALGKYSWFGRAPLKCSEAR